MCELLRQPWLPELLHQCFMVRALLAGLMVGIIGPMMGMFLVLRRLSLIGDTLAHVSLAGVAAGLLLGWYPVGMALAFAVVAGFGIERLREEYRNYGELAVAITLSTALAVAGVLLSKSRTGGADLMAYLFGSILTVSPRDLWVVAGFGAVVLVTVVVLMKELFFISFDEELARSGGVPVRGLNVLFTTLVAATIAVAIRVVGVLLVSSLLVLPAATALRLAGSYRTALWAAVGLAELAVVSGLLAAYYLDLAPGGSIVLAAALLLVVSLAIQSGRRRFRH